MFWREFHNATSSEWSQTLIYSIFDMAKFLKSVCSYQLSDGEKKLPVSTKVKIMFLSVTQYCDELYFSDCRFGIYAKSCIYSNMFGIKIRFWWKVYNQSCFWSKSCFCCSRTADSVSRTFDTRFGKFRVENTLGEMEFVFLSDVRHTLYRHICHSSLVSRVRSYIFFFCFSSILECHARGHKKNTCWDWARGETEHEGESLVLVRYRR